MKESVGVLALFVALVVTTRPAAAQGPPRLSNGHPDMNGIWQVLNEANYDLEPHMARHSMQLREGPMGPLPAVPTLRLGAIGAVPGSLGVIVVDGYQSKDRTARANGRDVTFEDGRKFFMGSSGTGAPRDGRDVTEPPR